MKKNILLTVCVAITVSVFATGCTVVSANRVFPKLTWYWSADAKEQRREKQAQHDAQVTPSKDWQGDLQKAIDAQRQNNQTNSQ